MIIALEDIAKKNIDIVDFASIECGKCAKYENNDYFDVYYIRDNDYLKWLDDLKNKKVEWNKNHNNNVLRSDYSGIRIKR